MEETLNATLKTKLVGHQKLFKVEVCLGCKSGYKGEKSEKCRSFVFPKDPNLRQLLCEQMNRNDLESCLNASTRYQICSRHFSKLAYVENAKEKRGRVLTLPGLKPNAYPTLYLNSKDDNLAPPQLLNNYFNCEPARTYLLLLKRERGLGLQCPKTVCPLFKPSGSF